MQGFKYRAFISYCHEDRELAGALQDGLRRFARPWNQLYAMRVYRDKTNLTPTSGLRRALMTALSSSEYLVLVASPASAESEWVTQEVKHFVDTRTPENILLVKAGGEIVWNEAKEDFDWEATDAVSDECLSEVFSEEPKYLDLSAPRTPGELTLKNESFRAAVASLSSRILDQPLDELVGEDVRHRRRTRLITRVAVGAFVVLLITLGVLLALAKSVDDKRKVAELAQAVEGTKRAAAELEAEEKAREARSRQGRQQQERGRRKLSEGRVKEALAHLSEAWRLGERGPVSRFLMAQAVHRIVSPGKPLSVPGKRVRLEYVKFLADGKRVLGIGQDGLVIWNLAGGTPIVFQKSIHLPAVSADGSRVVTRSDKTATVWDTASGKAVATFNHPGATVGKVAISPDGSTVVTALRQTLGAFVWKVGRAERVGYLKHDHVVSFVMFSPDGSRILTLGGGLMVWRGDDLSSITREIIRIDTKGAEPTHIAFSPEGRRLALAVGHRTVILDVRYRIDSYLSEKDRPMSGLAHPSSEKIRWMDFAKYSIVTAAGHGAFVWDRAGAQLADLKHPDSVRSAVFDDASSRVVTTCADGKIRVWDPATRKPIFSLEAPGGPSYADFSPDGRQLVSVSEEGHGCYWKDPSGRFPEVAADVAEPRALRVNGRAALLRWSGDVLESVDTKTGTRIATFDVAPGTVVDVATGGRRILTKPSPYVDYRPLKPGETPRREATARLWDAATASVVADLGVEYASFSPSGRYVYWHSLERMYCVWDSERGTLLMKKSFPEEYPITWQFSPDESRVLLSKGKGASLLLKCPRGELIRRLSSGTLGVNATLSPDGTRIAGGATYGSGNPDTLHLWDGLTGRQLRTARGVRRLLDQPQFSPDSSRILTIDMEQTVKLWRWDDATLVRELADDVATNRASFEAGTSICALVCTNSVRLFDWNDGRQIGQLEALEADKAEFGPARGLLIVQGRDEICRIWDYEREALLATLQGDLVDVRPGEAIVTRQGRKRLVWNLSLPASDDEVIPLAERLSGLRLVNGKISRIEK